MQSFIRAVNKKGKTVDIPYEPGTGVFHLLVDYAEKELPLPKKHSYMSRSLNEMYLSFMDPNGEIIAFQFGDSVRDGIDIIMEQMYFVDGPEKRFLKLERVYEFFKINWEDHCSIPDSFWRIDNNGRSIEIPHTKQTASAFRKKLSDCKEKASLPEIPIADFGYRRTVSYHHEVASEKYRVRDRILTDYDERASGMDFKKFRQEYDVRFQPPTIIGLAKEKKCREK